MQPISSIGGWTLQQQRVDRSSMDERICPSMFPRLGGQQNIAESMFGAMGGGPSLKPDTAEAEAALERVKFKKHMDSKGYHARIFNMHQDKELKAYEKLMNTLLIGTQAMTHKIWVNEFDLLNTPKGQQWHRYVEWSEFELKVEATRPTGM